MKNIIIFGYAFWGGKLYKELLDSDTYHCLGFADNDKEKQKGYVNGIKVKSIEDLLELRKEREFSIIIAAARWGIIGLELEKYDFSIEGVYTGNGIVPYHQAHFSDLDVSKDIILYAGDICDEKHLAVQNLFGLSINKGNDRHIYHDIRMPYPLPDNSISLYQAEDVLEHIPYENMVEIINEIWRILKPDHVFRICLPDYNSPFLSELAMRDEVGKIIYDAYGGGTIGGGGGHLWFPTYEMVKDLLSKTKFKKGEFLCYYTSKKELIRKEITDNNGYVNRIHQKIIYSMVVDCYKM